MCPTNGVHLSFFVNSQQLWGGFAWCFRVTTKPRHLQSIVSRPPSHTWHAHHPRRQSDIVQSRHHPTLLEPAQQRKGRKKHITCCWCVSSMTCPLCPGSHKTSLVGERNEIDYCWRVCNYGSIRWVHDHIHILLKYDPNQQIEKRRDLLQQDLLCLPHRRIQKRLSTIILRPCGLMFKTPPKRNIANPIQTPWNTWNIELFTVPYRKTV